MKELKFNRDYKKLPINWENTEAMLVGVASMGGIDLISKLGFFVVEDCAVRNSDNAHILDVDYDYLILSFIHIGTGKTFCTLRKSNKENLEKYNKLLEIFILKKE